MFTSSRAWRLALVSLMLATVPDIQPHGSTGRAASSHSSPSAQPDRSVGALHDGSATDSAVASDASGTRGQAEPDAGLATATEILVSRQLLESRALAVGDVVRLSQDPSGAGGRSFKIAGAFEPTPDPLRLTSSRLEARLHLPDLLALSAAPTDPLARESVASLNVALAEPTDAPRFASDLAARMPALLPALTHQAPGPDSPFVALERFHKAIAIVTVLGSTAFLLALMVMRADERRESAGILRLLGFSRRRILGVVLWEGLLTAAAGALFGVLFAASLQRAVNVFFQWKYDTALVFVRITLPIAARCVAFAVPLGVLAGLVASWSILRRDIAALIRR